MSKTDYKKMWRKEQDQNKILTDHINNNLIPRLRRAELVLYGIVFDEVDIPLMKEEYFKSNPEAKKLHEQAVQVQKIQPILNPNLPETLTRSELANYLRVSDMSVRRYEKEGAFKRCNVNTKGTPSYKKVDVENYLQSINKI